MTDKKPVLTLRAKPTPQPKERWGDGIYEIAAQELERADYNKTAALAATIKRITDDDALFRSIATVLIRKTARKRIKNLNRARTIAMQWKSE